MPVIPSTVLGKIVRAIFSIGRPEPHAATLAPMPGAAVSSILQPDRNSRSALARSDLRFLVLQGNGSVCGLVESHGDMLYSPTGRRTEEQNFDPDPWPSSLISLIAFGRTAT